jgi:serralysin
VIEAAGEGRDTVTSSIDYALTAEVEFLTLTGDAVRGTGNELDNRIIGNALGNELNGGAGNDILIGGDGIDRLTGGEGGDVFVAGLNSTTVSTKRGDLSLDLILDFGNGDDAIDLTGIDANTGVDGHQAFRFVGNSDAKTGEIGIKTYGNVNAAESVLGIDLDGVDGKSPFSGPVTVLFGNNDADKDADFAIVLFGTKNFGADDLMLAQTQIV